MTATQVTTRTLVVDGNNLLSRAVWATMRVPLTNEDGVPTAALHTFISMLAKYVRAEKPSHMVVCWDGGRSTYRQAVYPDYKAQRPDVPDKEEPDKPFAQAKEFLSLAGVHHVEQPGVEADDLIAGYWRQKTSSERVVILSSDKDFLQLLDGWTEQIRPGTGVDERWTANRVRTEMKCRPDQIPMIMALTGDTSDNIPGIPGFGHKTACKVLTQFDWSLHRACTESPKLLGQTPYVERNLALVDLRRSLSGVSLAPAPKFAPTTVTSITYAALEQFLLRYQLASVQSRLASNTLWTEG